MSFLFCVSAGFKVFQVGDDNETDDDQERPSVNLAEGNDVPCVDLVGVLPGAEIRGNVFGNPDEKADEKEREQQWHAAFFVDVRKEDCRAPEEDGDKDGERPAEIRNEVVSEKVEVDCSAQRNGEEVAWIVFNTGLEKAPGLREVTGDSGVHESGEQRDRGDFEKTRFRIAPRSDLRRRLEEFQAKTDHVEKTDRFEFIFCL